MLVRTRAALALAALLAWGPVAAGQDAASKIIMQTVVAKPRYVSAVAAPKKVEAAVKPQPAPVPPEALHIATAAPKGSALPSNVDLAAIREGRVIALKSGRPELVNEASVATQIANKQVLVERSDVVAKAVTLPAELRKTLAKSTETGSPPAQGLQLGYRVRAYAKGAQPKAVLLNPLLIDQRGLLLDARNQEYVGTVVVTLLDESNRPAAGDLETPVGVLVKAEGGVVEPSPARFDRYGPSAMQVLVIRVPHFPHDPFVISATADFGVTYDYASVAVTQPTLTVSPDKPLAIPGWGIGKATLTFHVSDIVGRDHFRLLLTGDVTGITRNPVPFDKDGFGSIEWRSHGTGPQTIEVATEGIKMRPITIDFTVPWAFLALSALGGIGGAFLRGRGSDQWPRVLLIGVVTALFMVGLCALGLGGWVKVATGSSAPELTGEAVIVILGTLAALVGVSVFVPRAKSAGTMK